MSFWEWFVDGLAFFWSPLLVTLFAFALIVATIIFTIGMTINIVIDGWSWLSRRVKIFAVLLWIFCVPILYTSFSLASYAIAHSTESGFYWQ